MKKSFRIIANWKMNVLGSEAHALARFSVSVAKKISPQRKIILCPSFPYLEEVANILKKSKVALGAQDAFFEASGAFTGEVSPVMLREMGCEYVILGHSERRRLGENDAMIGKKVSACFKAGLIPIVCVGENYEERKSGRAERALKNQVERIFRNVSFGKKERLMVAYEPVWAISTSRRGAGETPEDANEKQAFIQTLLRKRFGAAVMKRIDVMYGGSVDAKNIAAFAKEKNIAGALVGGASQKKESFSKLIRALS